MIKKGIAEFIGTFVLVLFGTGTAVLGGGIEGVGTLAIAMAFGLSIVAMADDLPWPIPNRSLVFL